MCFLWYFQEYNQTSENIFRKFFWNAIKHMKIFSFPKNNISEKYLFFENTFTRTKRSLKLKKGIQTQPYQNIKIKSILSDLVLKTKIWSRDRDQHGKDIETILSQSTISVWNDTVHVETNKWSWLLSLSLEDPTPTWTQYRDRDSSIDHVSINY